MEFTEAQISNFKAYEKVRASGKYNMFDPRAIRASGLPQSEYIFVMDNYTALEAAAAEQIAN